MLALVEGATEEHFIQRIVAPELRERSICIVATTPGRKRSHGGVRGWTAIKKYLRSYLKEDRERYVTTMFDYYGMPSDWPGRRLSADLQQHDGKASAVEKAMLQDISKVMEWESQYERRRFIPYVQMYEFEALLFSAPDILGGAISEDSQREEITKCLQDIADKFRTPEEIDNSPDSAPSKRINMVSLRFLQRNYEKVLNGEIAARRIGLPCIRQACPHFDEWLRDLESLGNGDVAE